MNEKLQRIEDAVATLLSGLNTDFLEESVIEEKVRAISATEGGIEENEIFLITRKLEERFNVKMSLGTLFSTPDYKPWLAQAQGDIDWYYWQRYRRLLLNQERFPEGVVRSLDVITDQILDHLEDPFKEGTWARKGMVVGHVQSGKTANYIGLINKAADSGYRVIIVLAGMLNSLRDQTQHRLDAGFIGYDTEKKDPLGVSHFRNEKRPAYFTTRKRDFSKSFANQTGVGIKDLREPTILVVKKNKSVLTNLIEWLKFNNLQDDLKAHPVLVIDDEADQASINTNRDWEDVTAINGKIRELLRLFDRSSYVGYTATPYANVFIDPETDDDMIGDDLFPRDFIFSLDPPSNYIGSKQIFSSGAELDIVREIRDYERYLPIKHKKEFEPECLPESFKTAINAFVLSCAIRILRGQENQHNSMLVNVSRFTKVQSSIRFLVDEYVKELRQSINNYYMLPDEEALQNNAIVRLNSLYLTDFAKTTNVPAWSQIQRMLKQAISKLSVIEVNSSASAEPLDYSEENYPNGRTVIAVGGFSLSRGLTLEGLTVSYYLRNSIMYDTMMQMGRWFGYRDEYSDLCRIYMPPEAASWYAYISDATEELRDEFRSMKAAGMTPENFGLCVRSHPDSLIVTARNKMRTGTRVVRQINLVGRLVETSVLYRDSVIVQQNLSAMETMIHEAQKHEIVDSSTTGGYLWHGVPAQYVLEFIERFQNHIASQRTQPGPLKEYIKWLEEAEHMGLWDVVLVNPRGQRSNINGNISDLEVRAQKRQVEEYPEQGGQGIALNKRRVASRGLEKQGLTEQEQRQAEDDFQATQEQEAKNIPDHAYRRVRSRPLLMLHLLDCVLNDESLFESGVAAYGISFPGEAGRKMPEKLVEYVVNTVWWQNEYGDWIDDEYEE